MLRLLTRIPAHRKGLIFISFTAFLWSTSGFFIKYLTISAYQISFYRSLVAAITIFVISSARKQIPKFRFDKISNLAAIFYAGILLLIRLLMPSCSRQRTIKLFPSLWAHRLNIVCFGCAVFS